MGITGGIWRALMVSGCWCTLGDLGCEVHPKIVLVATGKLELLVHPARSFTIGSVPLVEGSWPVLPSHSDSSPRILLNVGALTL